MNKDELIEAFDKEAQRSKKRMRKLLSGALLLIGTGLILLYHANNLFVSSGNIIDRIILALFGVGLFLLLVGISIVVMWIISLVRNRTD
jgi:hypothetical protein